MILRTIQTEAAWPESRARGVLRGNRERIMVHSWDGAYRWMVEQMTRRIGPPPSPAAYPVWAWSQYDGERRAKPDLRSGGHLPKGERGVRIEFECPGGLALLSDFHLWHHVINYWYLPENEADEACFEAELQAHGLSPCDVKPLRHPGYHQRIAASWDRIFDLDWREDGLARPRAGTSIQATVWEVGLDQVREETRFKAR